MLRILMYGVGMLMVTQLLGTALSLECYECTGPKRAKHDCEVNLAAVNVQNCTPGFYCTLYINTIGNQSTIHRLCSGENECDVIRATNTHVIDANRTLDTCFTCNSSLCNSAESKSITSSMFSLILLVLIVTVASNKSIS